MKRSLSLFVLSGFILTSSQLLHASDENVIKGITDATPLSKVSVGTVLKIDQSVEVPMNKEPMWYSSGEKIGYEVAIFQNGNDITKCVVGHKDRGASNNISYSSIAFKQCNEKGNDGQLLYNPKGVFCSLVLRRSARTDLGSLKVIPDFKVTTKENEAWGNNRIKAKYDVIDAKFQIAMDEIECENGENQLRAVTFGEMNKAFGGKVTLGKSDNKAINKKNKRSLKDLFKKNKKSKDNSEQSRTDNKKSSDRTTKHQELRKDSNGSSKLNSVAVTE